MHRIQNIQPYLKIIMLTQLCQLLHVQRVHMSLTKIYTCCGIHISIKTSPRCGKWLLCITNNKGCRFRFWCDVLDFPIYFSIIALFFLLYMLWWFFLAISMLSFFTLCLLDPSIIFVSNPHCSLLLCTMLSDSM